MKSSGFGSWYSNHGVPRGIRFRCIEKSKNRKCSESNSGRPKIWSKSGQNDPGTLIIGFALKNYAQKWSQIVKTLDGCPQNDDFGIFVRSLRTQLPMSIFLNPGIPGHSCRFPNDEKGGYGKPRIYGLDRRKTARISTLRDSRASELLDRVERHADLRKKMRRFEF